MYGKRMKGLKGTMLDESSEGFLFFLCVWQITTPILEHSELFERTLGGDSDIVSKEMYTFVSPGSDERITLRPEGTAGAIRAILNQTLGQPMPQKYHYHGPMFRRERPQKGRLRQVCGSLFIIYFYGLLKDCTSSVPPIWRRVRWLRVGVLRH